MKTKLVILILMCFYLALPGFAEPIAVESFKYPLGETIVGQNGGFGWADAWQAFEIDSDGVAEVGKALTVAGVSPIGNGLHLTVNNATNDKSTGVVRNLTQSVGEPGTTLWGSILVYEETEISDSDFFIMLGTEGNQVIAPGRMWWYNFSIDNNSSGIQQVPGQTYQLVFRFDFGVNNADCYLWVNPDMTEEPMIEDANATKTGFFNEGTYVRIRCNRYDDHDMTFDEFRLGTTFDDIKFADETLARYPNPGDASMDIPRDGTVLSWTPGEFAHTHTLYFSTDFNDVNNGTALLKDGLLDPNYALGRLDFGQTYFWRVDEVNAPPSNAVRQGYVWSFEVEPEGIPVPASAIHIDASGSVAPGDDPNNLINGSEAMWLSTPAEPGQAWVQLDLDQVYKLSDVAIWNYHNDFEYIFGLGIKEAVISLSKDGITFTPAQTVELTQSALTVINMAGQAASAIRITAHSNWGDKLSQYGLAEIQINALPVIAREMSPADEATNIEVIAPRLSWRAGREAAKHTVYISTNQQAVIDGTAPAFEVPQPSFEPMLDLGQTYYWRVDEVNEAETPTTHVGPVASFSTQATFIIDDFEAYDDDENLIYETWADGWGVADNGAQVGYDTNPFAETSIAKDGSQSMPLRYGLESIGQSEATRTYAPAQNWTLHGAQSLVIYFRGKLDNEPGQLYAKINGKRYDYQGASSDLQIGVWLPWTIDLVDAESVNSLTIGVEGGSGLLLVDAISLSPQASQIITPTQPDNAGLLAHYTLDGDAKDSSPNGLDGQEVGLVEYSQDTPRGQVGSFDGLDAAIDLGKDKGFNFTGSFSVAAWINIKGLSQNWGHVIMGTRGESGVGWQLRRWGTTPNLTFTIRGTDGVDDPLGSLDVEALMDQWIQVTAVYDMETGVRTVYINGLIDMQMTDTGAPAPDTHNAYIGGRANSENSGPEGFFQGLIDDVRVYQRPLDQAEALGLAGRTAPVYQP